MAIELAVAYVSVIPSVRGIQGELSRGLLAPSAAAGTTAGATAGRNFSKSFTPSLQGVRTAIRDVTIGAVGIGSALAAVGVKGAASLEQTTVAFTSLLGSSQAATQQIKELQQFAAATPFSQQDVLGYAQQYLSFAKNVGLAKDQVIPFLSAIGDLGAVTGASSADIANATRAIGQMASSGKVTLDNLNQVSEAFPGFNGAAAIAAATGQKTADVMKAISAGTVDASTGVQALLKGMQQFPGAAGAMVAQSKTLTGLFSTFKDTVSIALTQAFTPLIPAIKSILGDLTPVIAATLNQVAPVITAFVQDFMPALQPLIQGLGTALGAVLNLLGPALQTLAPVITPLANTFAQLLQSVSPLVQLLTQLAVTILPPLLGIFSQLAQALGPVVSALADALQPVLPVIAQAFAQIATALQPVVGALGQALVQLIQGIAPSLPDIARSFAAMAVALARILQSLAPVVALFARFSGMGIAAMFEAMVPELQLVAQGLGAIADAIGTAVSGMQILTGATVESSAGLDASVAASGRAGVGIATLGLQAQATAQAIIGVAAAIANAAQAAAATPATPAFDLPSLGGAPINFGTGTKKTPRSKPKFDPSTITSLFQTATNTSTNPITAALNAVFASAQAAGKRLSNGLVKQLEAQNTRLIGLTKARERIATRLQSAQQALSSARANRSAEVSTVRNAFTGSFSVAGSGTGFDGQQAVTFDNILAQVTQAANRATSFASLLKRLAHEGLSKTLLSQLAEAGPAAYSQAKALAQVTPQQLALVNAQYRRISTAGSQTGAFIAHDLYDAGVNSAKGLVRGLESQQSALNAAIRKLAASMVKELKNSLGIHSPSAVLHELGQFTAVGFANGIDAKYGAVSDAAARMANGAVPASQMRSWSADGVGGQGGDVIIPLIIDGHEAARAIITRDAIRRGVGHREFSTIVATAQRGAGRGGKPT